MRRNQYGGYRGRRTGRDLLKYLIVALLVVIAVLAAILILGEERPEQLEEPVGQDQLQEQPQTPELPEPESEPEPVPEAMAAVSAEIAQVLDGSWKSWLEQQGANALILNMKPDDGILAWDEDKSPAESAVNSALARMNGGEVYTVARISCFRDEMLANTYDYCIHSNSGYRWKDFGGVHWVSPAHAEVQDRLIARAVELAELGFDEILLDNCGYPQDGSGEMGWIKRGEVYDLENLDLVIGEILARLRQALEPYEVVLSVRTNAVVVADPGAAKTGLTGAVLEEYADRVWMSEVDTDAPLAEILTLAGVSGVEERLVIQSAALQNGANWAQAVLSF